MIYCWALPSANVDPYETYEPSVLQNRLRGHTSAVWGLSMCESRSQLLSLSADGTVKLWSPESQSPLLHTYVSEQDGIPTSVDFIRDESHKLVVAYEGACVVFDTETGESVARLEANETKGVNRVVAHPTLPLVVAAHEDIHIRFMTIDQLLNCLQFQEAIHNEWFEWITNMGQIGVQQNKGKAWRTSSFYGIRCFTLVP